MHTIHLQRILGQGLNQAQYTELQNLAYSCPLEAGNAVYRARTLLRNWGNYTFEDAVLCGREKEEGKEDDEGDKKNKSLSAQASIPQVHPHWRIYPNPTQGQIWLEGSQGAKLNRIQLYDHLGRMVLKASGENASKQALNLPADLPVGLYFLVLEQADGHRQTQKLIIKP